MMVGSYRHYPHMALIDGRECWQCGGSDHLTSDCPGLGGKASGESSEPPAMGDLERAVSEGISEVRKATARLGNAERAEAFRRLSTAMTALAKDCDPSRRQSDFMRAVQILEDARGDD